VGGDGDKLTKFKVHLSGARHGIDTFWTAASTGPKRPFVRLTGLVVGADVSGV